MILKIYTKQDNKSQLPFISFICDCIAVGSEKECDKRDITKEIAYLDVYYIEKGENGKLQIVERDFKVENIAKIRGERNGGLIGFLDDAVAEALIDVCEDLEYRYGVSIDVQVEYN